MAEPINSKWRNIIINVFTLLIAFLICMALAEAWVRVFRDDRLAPDSWPEENAQFVPGLRKNVYVNLSNLTKATSEFSYTLSTNQYGFRDFHDFEREKGIKRIVAVGASSLFGNTVEANETYLKVLGEQLGVETINLGLGGNGFDEMKYILGEYGMKYKPDLIIVEVGLANLYATFQFNERSEIPQRQPFFLWMYKHSKAISYFYWQVKTTPLGFKIIQFLRLNKHGQDSTSFDLEVLQHQNTLPVNNSKIGAFRNLQEMKELAGESEVPLLVIYLPPSFQINQAKLEQIALEYGLEQEQIDVAAAENFFTAIANKLNLPFFSPTADLQHHPDATRLGWQYDSHFNPQGNSIYATLLADFIQKNKLLVLHRDKLPVPPLSTPK